MDGARSTKEAFVAQLTCDDAESACMMHNVRDGELVLS